MPILTAKWDVVVSAGCGRSFILKRYAPWLSQSSPSGISVFEKLYNESKFERKVTSVQITEKSMFFSDLNCFAAWGGILQARVVPLVCGAILKKALPRAF